MVKKMLVLILGSLIVVSSLFTYHLASSAISQDESPLAVIAGGIPLFFRISDIQPLGPDKFMIRSGTLDSTLLAKMIHQGWTPLHQLGATITLRRDDEHATVSIRKCSRFFQIVTISI